MTHYITQDGIEKLAKELEYLKNNKRKEVIARIQAAKELGDLSENAEYMDARDEQSFIEGRIGELETLIKKSEIINHNQDKDIVRLGSTVTVECDGNIKKIYTIVGSNEADPMQGFISNESPIGRAFLGRQVGDMVEVDIPKGKLGCKIINVE